MKVPLILMPLDDILAMFPREAPRMPWWCMGTASISNAGYDPGISGMELEAQQQAGLVRNLPLAPTLASAFPSTLRW